MTNPTPSPHQAVRDALEEARDFCRRCDGDGRIDRPPMVNRHMADAKDTIECPNCKKARAALSALDAEAPPDYDLDQGKKNFKAAKWILESRYDEGNEFVRKAKQIAADFVGMWRKNENQRFELNRFREQREKDAEAKQGEQQPVAWMKPKDQGAAVSVLQKPVEVADSNPFCSIGHLIEHVVPAARSLIVSHSRPSPDAVREVFEAIKIKRYQRERGVGFVPHPIGNQCFYNDVMSEIAKAARALRDRLLHGLERMDRSVQDFRAFLHRSADVGAIDPDVMRELVNQFDKDFAFLRGDKG